MVSVWPANKPCLKLWENINEEIFVKWDFSKEEAIYRQRDSSAGLDSLIVFLLILKTQGILCIIAAIWAIFYSNEPF